MTWTRRLRVMLVGIIAAEAAAYTAGGPRWRATVPGVVRPAGYTADGGTFVAVCAPSASERHAPTVWRWDVATGRGQAAEIPHPYVLDDTTAHPLGAGQAIFVWEDAGFNPTYRPGSPFAWQVYDTTTGRPPVVTAAALLAVWPCGVSPDGTHAAVVSPDRPPRVVLIALPGGGQVGTLAGTPEQVRGVAFAPAGDRAAVLWRATGDPRLALDIVAVPSGHRLRRIDLPEANDWELAGWHGDRVIVTATLGNPDGDDRRWLTYQIDPTAASPALEPRPAAERRRGRGGMISRRTGPNWVGLAAYTAPSPVVAWWGRLLKTVGRKRDEDADWAGRVTTFRPDGSVAGEYFVRHPIGRLHVAPDGRSAVCVRRNTTVELWDADPPSPWPRAVVAGLLAAGGWAWLERRRARR